jgi:hypothetical protein
VRMRSPVWAAKATAAMLVIPKIGSRSDSAVRLEY